MSSANQIAFKPTGLSRQFNVTTSASLGVQVLPNSNGYAASGQYRVVNAGTATAFLAVGTTPLTAKSLAVIPTEASPSNVIPIVPGTVEIVSFEQDAYFSLIGSAATTVYITPGRGL